MRESGTQGERLNLLLLQGQSENFPSLKVPKWCPLVLLVEVAGNKTRALGGDEGIVMGDGLLGASCRGKKMSFWAGFVCAGQRYGDILIRLGGRNVPGGFNRDGLCSL